MTVAASSYLPKASCPCASDMYCDVSRKLASIDSDVMVIVFSIFAPFAPIGAIGRIAAKPHPRDAAGLLP